MEKPIDLHAEAKKATGQPERVETEFDGIKLVSLTGDIKGYSSANQVIEAEMKRLGILDDPSDYLIRQVRATMINKLVLEGCERDETSYRDPVLEEDLELAPDEYTYAHSFDGDRKRFVKMGRYMIEGSGRTATVFYKAKEMVPHHEEKYDAASSLGLGPTKVTYSFRNPNRKAEAIYAVVKYSGKFIDELE